MLNQANSQNALVWLANIAWPLSDEEMTENINWNVFLQTMFDNGKWPLWIVLTLLLFWLLINSLKRRKQPQYRLERLLKPYLIDRARSVVIPDGIGGYLEIEQLLLLKQGLLVMQSYGLNGYLFGADKIDTWTQIINGRSYKFANPLQQLQFAKQSLAIVTPRIPIHTHALFAGNCDFPKGKPQQVSTLKTLEADLQSVLEQRPLSAATLEPVWQSVLKLSNDSRKKMFSGVN